MRKPKTFLTIVCLLALGSAVPARAAGSCYQESALPFYQEVVQIVDYGVDDELGCWLVRLRLRGKRTPQGHAMICEGNACEPHRGLLEGIYWWEAAEANENIALVIPKQNGSCTDVSFCIVPKDVTETMLIHFVAFFEEGYFQSSPPTWSPRWSDGVIDLSSLDGSKSHCQDGDPRGAVCLEH